jgi:hypothetical protein
VQSGSLPDGLPKGWIGEAWREETTAQGRGNHVIQPVLALHVKTERFLKSSFFLCKERKLAQGREITIIEVTEGALILVRYAS